MIRPKRKSTTPSGQPVKEDLEGDSTQDSQEDAQEIDAWAAEALQEQDTGQEGD